MSAIEEIKERNLRKAQERADLEEFRAFKQAQEAKGRQLSEQKAYDLGASDASKAVEQLLVQRGVNGAYPKENIGQYPQRDTVSNFFSGLFGATPQELERDKRLGSELEQAMQQDLVNEAILNAQIEGDSSENNINKHINMLKGNR